MEDTPQYLLEAERASDRVLDQEEWERDPEYALYHPKPSKRYRASLGEWEIMRRHFADEGCWICDAPWRELHHILPRSHSGDDLTVNLAPLCSPCHRLVEARDQKARAALRGAFMPSNVAYLGSRLGKDRVEGWLERNYGLAA